MCKLDIDQCKGESGGKKKRADRDRGDLMTMDPLWATRTHQQSNHRLKAATF